MTVRRCAFCGGDTHDPEHRARCTSRAAMRSLTPGDVARVEAAITACLRSRPRTCDAVEVATGLSHQTASARVRVMVKNGVVVDTGTREPTRSGRRAVVWALR